MVEIELSVLVCQCLKRRLPDVEVLRGEVEACQAERNRLGANVEKFVVDVMLEELEAVVVLLRSLVWHVGGVQESTLCTCRRERLARLYRRGR